MITRRGFLVGAAASGLLACRRGPLITTSVPAITHGVQAGDVSGSSALIWARSSEPARMLVEWATTDGFNNVTKVAGPVVGPDTDFTGRVTLTGLPAAQAIHYRVRFEREAERGTSEPVLGRFATARPDRMRIAWTGDTCGQGFGRNPEWGGMKGYAAIRAAAPDVFLHSGDLIYADNPILAEQQTHDGRTWKNITNERVGRVAQELADFRARFAYNYEDEHVRALAAEVPIVAAWDDHETHNNWWPGQILPDDRYTIEARASVLAARALQATREWTPISGRTVNRVIHCGPLLDIVVVDLRTFRSPNDVNTGESGTMLGSAQANWLVAQLADSKARWKVVACDQPLALVIGDGPGDTLQEGYANSGTASPPRGREIELARVLAHLKQRRVTNVIWLTADVHYAAHHAFDPARAIGADFSPFHEFIAGPIHAGSFGPSTLDPTFGPEAKFIWAPPAGKVNLAPWDGLASFGTVDVSRDRLTVSLLGIDGKARYSIDLPATS